MTDCDRISPQVQLPIWTELHPFDRFALHVSNVNGVAQATELLRLYSL